MLPFSLCNTPTIFQCVVFSNFADFIHETMEAFMDDFTSHGGDFKDSLNNFEKITYQMHRGEFVPQQ